MRVCAVEERKDRTIDFAEAAEGFESERILRASEEVQDLLREEEFLRPTAIAAVDALRATFPRAQIKVTLTIDPDDGSETIRFRASIDSPTNEDRMKAAGLGVDFRGASRETGIDLVFGVGPI